MNARQQAALQDPYQGGPGIEKYRRIKERADGSLLVVVLAVDR